MSTGADDVPSELVPLLNQVMKVIKKKVAAENMQLKLATQFGAVLSTRLAESFIAPTKLNLTTHTRLTETDSSDSDAKTALYTLLSVKFGKHINMHNGAAKDRVGKCLAWYCLGSKPAATPLEIYVDLAHHHAGTQISTKADDIVLAARTGVFISMDAKTVAPNAPRSYQASCKPNVRSADCYFLVMWKDSYNISNIQSWDDIIKAIEAIVIVDTAELKHYFTAVNFRVNLEKSGIHKRTCLTKPGKRQGFRSLRLVSRIDLPATNASFKFGCLAAQVYDWLVGKDTEIKQVTSSSSSSSQ